VWYVGVIRGVSSNDAYAAFWVFTKSVNVWKGMRKIYYCIGISLLHGLDDGIKLDCGNCVVPFSFFLWIVFLTSFSNMRSNTMKEPGKH